MNYEAADYRKNPILNGFGGEYPDLSFLKGKQIVNIGWLAGNTNISISLAIDYLDNTDKNTKRVVFGYSDLGFYIVWQGYVGVKTRKDLLKERLAKEINNLEDLDFYSVDMTNGFTITDKDGNIVLDLTDEETILAGVKNKILNSKKKIADAEDEDVYYIIMGLDWFSGS